MKNDLIIQLHSVGAIKFGTFETKKDFFSPFQVDFSGVISHPSIAREVCAVFAEKAKHLHFELLCGTPAMGACFATFLAWENEFPLIALRTEGTSKVYGSYKTGQKCLLLCDVLRSGSDILQSIDSLEDEGVEVTDILSFIDLGIGGKEKVKGRGYVSHSVMGISEVIQILFDSGKLAGDSYKLATDFLENV